MEALDPADILTPAELAKRLKVSESWVREKTRSRATVRDADPLPALRMGRYVRFSWQAVSAWLLRQNGNGTAKGAAAATKHNAGHKK